jgi:dephospho-CoA kinase
MENNRLDHDVDKSKELPSQFPIVGIVGPMGSGKETIADILKQNYNFPKFSASWVVRDFASKNGYGATRDELWKARQQMVAEFGSEDVLSYKTLEEITTAYCHNPAIPGASIEGVRFLADAKYYKQHPGTLLIGVEATPQTRLDRIRKRNRSGDLTTIEEFENREAIENTQLTDIYTICDVVLPNDESREDLEQNVVEFMNSRIPQR